jgi:hypothetical protein
MISTASELAQRFWESPGLPDCPIVDMHAHMGELALGYQPRDTAETMLRTLDRCNVALTCFAGFEALAMPVLGETYDIDSVRRHPDRFRAYYTIQSRHADFERDLAEYEAHPDVFVGFKIHARGNLVALSDPRNEPYWEYADEHRLPVLAHTWGPDPLCSIEETEKVLRAYPNLRFIAGHSFHGRWEDACALALRHDQLYLELTAVLDDRGPLELFCRKAGSERLLFGVDMPWFSTIHGIGAVLSADITDEERRNIFYRNAVGLLRGFPWFDGIWSAHESRGAV